MSHLTQRPIEIPLVYLKTCTIRISQTEDKDLIQGWTFKNQEVYVIPWPDLSYVLNKDSIRRYLWEQFSFIIIILVSLTTPTEFILPLTSNYLILNYSLFLVFSSTNLHVSSSYRFLSYILIPQRELNPWDSVPDFSSDSFFGLRPGDFSTRVPRIVSPSVHTPLPYFWYFWPCGPPSLWLSLLTFSFFKGV